MFELQNSGKNQRKRREIFFETLLRAFPEIKLRGLAVSFLGIHKSDLLCSVNTFKELYFHLTISIPP
jgi:hypothetical protein